MFSFLLFTHHTYSIREIRNKGRYADRENGRDKAPEAGDWDAKSRELGAKGVKCDGTVSRGQTRLGTPLRMVLLSPENNGGSWKEFKHVGYTTRFAL